MLADIIAAKAERTEALRELRKAISRSRSNALRQAWADLLPTIEKVNATYSEMVGIASVAVERLACDLLDVPQPTEH